MRWRFSHSATRSFCACVRVPEISRGGFFPRSLKTQLEMIEARGDERFEALFIEGQARGDQAGVKAGGARGADKFGRGRGGRAVRRR